MEKKNSIVKDIAIGVAVGAAVTMLRKENRKMLASNARRAKTKMIEIREHAAPIKDRVRDGVQSVGAKGREMVDLKIVKEKVGEFRKLTPAVVETLKETRDIFNKKKQELKETPVSEVIEPEDAAREQVSDLGEPVGELTAVLEIASDMKAEEEAHEALIEKEETSIEAK